jgi:hypothetical protein
LAQGYLSNARCGLFTATASHIWRTWQTMSKAC